MPETLHIFISYAEEDSELASSFRDALGEAFGPGLLRVSFAPEFALGTPWRKAIEDELNDADILLALSTGQQKDSHSYTGFEVGFFRKSVLARPRMEQFESDRLIVSVSLLGPAPLTLADVQGVVILPSAARGVTLASCDGFVAAMEEGPDPLKSLFEQLRDLLVQKPKSGDRLQQSDIRILDRRTGEATRRLYEKIFAILTNRTSYTTYPERKIVVRVPRADTEAGADRWSEAKIELAGDFVNAFGITLQPGTPHPWPQFVASMPNDETRLIWTENVKALVSEAVGGIAENRQTVTSREQDCAFRMFVSRRARYLDDTDEVHIYVIEMKQHDFVDPTTTMLLNALSIGLHYRHMFLEPTSPYSPQNLVFARPEDLKDSLQTMRKQLDLLLWRSKAAGLRDSANIALIFGDKLDFDTFVQRNRTWQEVSEKLTVAVNDVMAADGRRFAQRHRGFIDVLEEFCESTREMNRDFTVQVFAALQKIVGSDLGRVASPAIHPPQAGDEMRVFAAGGNGSGPPLAPGAVVMPRQVPSSERR